MPVYKYQGLKGFLWGLSCHLPQYRSYLVLLVQVNPRKLSLGKMPSSNTAFLRDTATPLLPLEHVFPDLSFPHQAPPLLTPLRGSSHLPTFLSPPDICPLLSLITSAPLQLFNLHTLSAMKETQALESVPLWSQLQCNRLQYLVLQFGILFYKVKTSPLQ